MSSTPTNDPRSGGLAYALWTLVKPTTFRPVDPAHAGLAYDSPTRRGVPPLCDVYLPSGPGPHPSVILVHGGGFVLGHRAMKPVRLLASRLCENGYAVCSVDYRLLFRGGGLDSQLDDVNKAAAFWLERCERFDCDPARVSMAGFSAGAALMNLHSGRHPRNYQRLVSIYGPSDFEQLQGRRAALMMGLVMGSRDRREWRKRSPIHSLAPNPMLIVHGTADQLVPFSHSVRLHEAREAEGLPTELELVEGMRHGWLNDADLPETHAAVERILRFLDGT
ncbi:MAG: alpha/beta hydrolase family protein [Sandaracinaceae bacterium]